MLSIPTNFRFRSEAHILITTVPRSGASMLFELLSTLGNRSFGLHEPMEPFDRLVHEKIQSTLPDENCIHFDEIETYLKTLFSCQFNKQAEQFRQSRAIFEQWLLSNATKRSIPALQNLAILEESKRLTFLNRICLKSDLKLVKVVRLSHNFTSVEQRKMLNTLMESDPKLEVIGLIKDPRAVHSSL